MKKEFNTTGNCLPEEHYMMDNSAKFAEVMSLIERGKYFTMNHPRQFGKTTMLFQLFDALALSDNYLPVAMNFQGIDRACHESDGAFGRMFIELLAQGLELAYSDLSEFVRNQDEVVDLTGVAKIITRLVQKADRKIVLFIDEVDASSNYAAFLNFLGMLRNKYLVRSRIPTFYSIVLVGVHDIKNLKFKLRNPEEAQYNSPWNIAIDFEVDLSFNPKEIAPMLEQYSQEEDVQIDIPIIAQRLYYHTSGYPFLICKLCKNIVDKVLPQKTNQMQWTLKDVETSVQLLFKENNTNFDSLFNNLENHKDLYDLVERILLLGDRITFNSYNPTIQKGVLYGIFKRNGQLKIHNRIYEQLIYSYLGSKLETKTYTDKNIGVQFILNNGSLDFELVLQRFQQFIKEEYSDRDEKFLERQWRLLFLAFIRPIVNGEGYTFKEVQVSQEKRLDVVVTYQQYRYIVELKNWYGQVYHEKGLDQLADYLDIHNLSEGFLLIFDNRRQKTWEIQRIQHCNKKIYTVWV